MKFQLAISAPDDFHAHLVLLQGKQMFQLVADSNHRLEAIGVQRAVLEARINQKVAVLVKRHYR